MTTNNGHSNADSNRTVVEKRPIKRTAAAPKKKRSFFWLYAFLFFVIMGCLLAYVFLRRNQAQDALVSATQQMATPTVILIHPELGPTDVHLVLPGKVQAYMESAIYAQVSGYLKHWLVDIGAQVKEGQLLAEIETPEIDQQLEQAQASQNQVQANVNLSQVTANRYNDLRKTNAVSQEDVDQKNGDLAVQQANLAAAQANVRRLEEQEAFKQVRAPFDGVVTSRKVDVGDLINVGSGATTVELFRVAQTKTLRVYVNVPENYSSATVPGISATLDMASSPGQKITGKLVRTADAIDPSSLTLLSEVDVPNPDGKLLPGGYAQVHFDITTDHPPLVIPGNTLLFRAQGTQVGVVDTETNTAHLKDIKIGRDFGTKLEVIEGLNKDDSIIVNPSDSLIDGAKVRIDTNAKPKTS